MYKVYQLKIQNPDMAYFGRLFAEAKWWYNHILSAGIKGFDTKLKTVVVKRGESFEPEDLKHLSSGMRQQIYQRMWENLKGLSAKKKVGRKVGALKHKSFINAIPLSNQTFRLKGKHLHFQAHKTGFKVCGIKQLGENPDIRKGELIRKPSGFYLSVTIRTDEKPEVKSGFVGLDMGIKDALTFHDGSTVNFTSPELVKDIKRARQSISRKQLGSRNREKAKAHLRRLEEKLSAQKTDAVNKLIGKLKKHKVCFQDELIKGWHSGRFGRQVQASILGRLKALLKRDTANPMVESTVATTQYCPDCSSLNKHDLSQRVYTCSCGYSAPRDKHSANNMLVLSGWDTASVEKVSDVFGLLQSIQSAQLSVKQESPSKALA